MSLLKSFNFSKLYFKQKKFTLYYSFTRYFSSEDSEDLTYDLVVVGGGSGGLACAKEAACLGKKVAVLDYVEPSPHGTKWGLGGTCVNVGCIPKKLCHHASMLGGALKYANKYGWDIKEPPEHDWTRMIKNITDHIKSLNFKHRVKLTESKVKYINAKGIIVNNHLVKCELNNKSSLAKTSLTTEILLRAGHIVIATGKRPRIPNVPGAKELCITSDDIFWKTTPPGKVLCIGAGYVSLELAGFLQGLGYSTTVMARTVALSKFDQQMANLVLEAMERYGTRVLLHTMPEKIEKSEETKVKVTWRSRQTGVNSDVFDTVVMATGRVASMNMCIGLKEVGVLLDTDGCVVGNYGGWKERSSVPNIFAIGDSLQNGLELTPVAARAGKLLARRLYGGGNEHMDYENVATTVFTPVEYGFIGLSEEQAVSRYGEEGVEVYHAFYKPLEYNLADAGVDHESCYIKALVLRTAVQEVVGLHFTGPHAGEVIQGFAVAFKCGLTYPLLTSTLGIHPTVAEELTKLHITKRSGLDATVTGC